MSPFREPEKVAWTGGFTLVLSAVAAEEPARAIPGASFAVYWASDSLQEWRTEYGWNRQEPLHGDQFKVIGSMEDVDTPAGENSVRVIAGPDGIARARLPENRIVGIVAGKEGRPVEWIPAVVTGERGGTSSLSIVLFPSRVEVSTEGHVGAEGPFRPFDDDVWKPVEIRFSSDSALNGGFLRRLGRAEVEMEWRSSIPATADIGLALGWDRDYIGCPTCAENEIADIGQTSGSEKTFESSMHDWPKALAGPVIIEPKGIMPEFSFGLTLRAPLYGLRPDSCWAYPGD